MTRRASLLLLPALPLLGACGGGGSSGQTGLLTPGALSVHAVDWNPGKADVGAVSAVTDLGGTTAVFSDKGLQVMLGGAVSATDASVTTWDSAGVIPAADGNGEWLVGIDAKGQLYSVEALDHLQPVSDRFGLSKVAVHEVAAAGSVTTAFRLDSGVAIADGNHVTQYDLPYTSLAGSARARIAGVGAGAVHVFDLAEDSDTSIDIGSAQVVTFDTSGRVVAATEQEIYREDDKGTLAPLVDLSKSGVHGLAASPAGIWVSAGTELGLLADDTFSLTSGANLPSDAKLVGASSGDVWILSKGALTRQSASAPGDETLWDQSVQPIFTRVCSACHLPGGTANIDLSYYGAWVQRRALIEKRVVEKVPTPMPPAGSGETITADDVNAIAAWVKHGS